MTKHNRSAAALLLLLGAGLLAGCSSQKAASEQNALAVPAGTTTNSAGTQPAPPEMGKAQGLFTSNGSKLAADYQRQCAGEKTPPENCEILRSLLVAEVVTDLELTERSKDQRGVQEALVALDLPDEPEIFI